MRSGRDRRPIEHAVEEFVEAGDVRRGDFGEALRHARAEVQAEHAAHAVARERHADRLRRVDEPIHQPRRARGQVFVEARGLDQPERGESGRHGQRVARERACLIDAAQRREVRHDVASSAEGRRRHAAADDLAQAGEVGGDAVERLSATQPHAEAAHHFVENQHRAVRGAQLAQRLQEVARAAHEIHVAGDRLDDHRGDFAALTGKELAQLLDIVVLQHERVARDFGRHAGRRRCIARRIRKREQAGAGLHEQAVGMAVVAAFELHDLVAACEAARETQRAHGRLGARGHQPHLFDGRHETADFLGHDHFGFGRRAEAEALRHRGLHGGNDVGMQMADDHWPPRADVVDIARALGVPHVGALGAGDETRGAAHGAESAHGRVDPAGNGLLGALEKGGVGGGFGHDFS